MLQRLDVPIQSLTTDITTTIHQTDYFPSIINVFKKCKNSLENDRRLENFNWRLWRRGSTQSTTSTEQSSFSTGDTWSSCSYDSSSSYFSMSSNPSTFIDTSSKEIATNESTQFTSSYSELSRQQQKNKHTPKLLMSEIENINAVQQAIQTPRIDEKIHHGDTNDDDDDDDESTLFGGDDEIENTDIPGSVVGVSSTSNWPCCEFKKKQATPIVDQRSLLSSMLLHDSSPASTKMKSSSLSPPPPSLSMFISSASTISTATTLLNLVEDDNVLSSSMKQHVDWEKMQNGGPAAGLMGIAKKIQGTPSSNPASSMTLVCNTLDTFTGCW